MTQVNVVGVLKGGLAAGLVMNISQFLLNVPVAGEQMAKELAARNLPEPGQQAVFFFIALTFVLGILTVWLYAAIRPRFGAGPKTAIAAGLVVWFLTYVYAAMSFGVLGVNSMGLVLVGIVWTMVEMIIASAVGGYFYTEEPAAI